MDITPLIPEGRQVIESYAAGRFRIGGALYFGPVIVFPEQVVAWEISCNASPFTITIEDFRPLVAMAGNIDVVLLGTGPEMNRPDSGIRHMFKTLGLNVEIMDTGAAARTYNVLMPEGRRVAAALLPV